MAHRILQAPRKPQEPLAFAWCRALEELEKETQDVMREALRVQMMEFGRTPKQLFTKPHPRRRPTCCSCFGAPQPSAQAARPANVLHPTLVQVGATFQD